VASDYDAGFRDGWDRGRETLIDEVVSAGYGSLAARLRALAPTAPVTCERPECRAVWEAAEVALTYLVKGEAESAHAGLPRYIAVLAALRVALALERAPQTPAVPTQHQEETP